MVIICKVWVPYTQARTLYAKFGRDWPIGSGEKDEMRQCIFTISLLFTLQKGPDPLYEQA